MPIDTTRAAELSPRWSIPVNNLAKIALALGERERGIALLRRSIEIGNHNLTIGESAAVVADLIARDVTVAGSVKGNVLGSGKVELKKSSTVEGDITAPRFSMEEGAVLMGKVDTGERK